MLNAIFKNPNEYTALTSSINYNILAGSLQTKLKFSEYL